MILLLITLPPRAFASPLSWPLRLASVRQCHAARVIFMEAAGDASSLLWWASTDNHRSGFLNPSIVIEARQRVQEAIAAADWRFTDLAARDPVNPQACRQHALIAGAEVFDFTRRILANPAVTAPPSAQRTQRRPGLQQEPRMLLDRGRLNAHPCPFPFNGSS